jgi:signal transduction histidine kinase
MIRTALTNIIRNAIEAAPSDGWVRVSVEPADASWNIIVEDSGPGPEPAQCEHLFDPFYSGRIAGRGRGLGLSTAWRLAKENGGDVRFDPVEGRPTRFILRLPKANPFHRDEVIPDQGATLKIA